MLRSAQEEGVTTQKNVLKYIGILHKLVVNRGIEIEKLSSNLSVLLGKGNYLFCLWVIGENLGVYGCISCVFQVNF